MRARYGSLQSEAFGDELQKMYPVLTESGSDSATLDNMIQFLAVNGRSLPHAVFDGDPRGVAKPRADGPGLESVLRISRLFDGALGRAGQHFLHQWQCDWRGAGS